MLTRCSPVQRLARELSDWGLAWVPRDILISIVVERGEMVPPSQVLLMHTWRGVAWPLNQMFRECR